MCAIVGSFSGKKLAELLTANSYRGSFSYSLSYTEDNGELIVVSRNFGVPKEDVITEFTKLHRGKYLVAHIQAPTGGLVPDNSRIHPSTIQNSHLYHNGILKSSYMKQNEYNGWDTRLLHTKILNDGFDVLSEVDGAFSCLFSCNKKLYLFRNSTSPMFVDENLNISSTKFIGSTHTEFDTVYTMNLDTRLLERCYTFNNINTPYFFGN